MFNILTNLYKLNIMKFDFDMPRSQNSGISFDTFILQKFFAKSLLKDVKGDFASTFTIFPILRRLLNGLIDWWNSRILRFVKGIDIFAKYLLQFRIYK